MLIRELHIQNFRRFEDLKVSFEEDLTVLVARNGHGKSSILEAITILLGTFVGAFDLGRAKGLSARDARRSLQPSTKEPRQDWPVRIEGSVVFPLDPFDQVEFYSFFPEIPHPGYLVARELVNAKSRTTTREVSKLTAYGQHLQDSIHRADNVVLPVIAYYGTGRLWKAHKNILRKQVLTQNRSLGYEDCLSPSSSFVQVQQWMDRASRARSQELERKEIEHWGPRLQGIQKAVDSVLEEEGWTQFAYSYDYEELSMFHPDHGRLAVSQMSDGVRGVVSLVADLAFRCMRLNSPFGEEAIIQTKGIVLIDEVDQHLHPGWQQRILRAIRRAFPNIQFIVTTHSPEVLTTVESRQIRILQEGKCYGAPAGALGAESSRLLQTVLGLKNLRPPLNEVNELNEYLELVYTGRWKDPRAVALRQKLDQLYQGEEPALLDADLQIENQEWEAAAPQ
jgi:predicted ATP-binding protein involved in virulence